jgi:hypothetical protein
MDNVEVISISTYIKYKLNLCDLDVDKFYFMQIENDLDLSNIDLSSVDVMEKLNNLYNVLDDYIIYNPGNIINNGALHPNTSGVDNVYLDNKVISYFLLMEHKDFGGKFDYILNLKKDRDIPSQVKFDVSAILSVKLVNCNLNNIDFISNKAFDKIEFLDVSNNPIIDLNVFKNSNFTKLNTLLTVNCKNITNYMPLIHVDSLSQIHVDSLSFIYAENKKLPKLSENMKIQNDYADECSLLTSFQEKCLNNDKGKLMTQFVKEPSPFYNNSYSTKEMNVDLSSYIHPLVESLPLCEWDTEMIKMFLNDNNITYEIDNDNNNIRIVDFSMKFENNLYENLQTVVFTISHNNGLTIEKIYKDDYSDRTLIVSSQLQNDCIDEDEKIFMERLEKIRLKNNPTIQRKTWTIFDGVNVWDYEKQNVKHCVYDWNQQKLLN